MGTVVVMSQVLIQTSNESNNIDPNGKIGTLRRLKLSPPYLRELPMELAFNEADFQRKGYRVRDRLMLHTLWAIFRVCYFLGWMRGRKTTHDMPHLVLPITRR